MIISEKHKFIFIAVPKTGTTSVERALAPYGSTVTTVSREGKHKTALEVRSEVGEEIWNSYFTFAFVRNPLDWIASWYTFRTRDELADKDHPKHQNYTGEMSFSEFVTSYDRIVRGKGQSRYVTDDGNRIIVDFIGRFEALQSDFDTVCRKIGIRPIRLGSLNRSKFTARGSLYTDDLKQMVASSLSQDMKLFGYDADYRADRLKGRTWWRYLKDALKENFRHRT